MSRIAVGIAEVAVASSGAQLTAVGIGSCVAIALYDSESRVGALAHVLLPDEQERHDGAEHSEAAKHGKTPQQAVPFMLNRMREMGMSGQPTARIIGGASMFADLLAPDTIPIGARNISASRAACAKANVTITGEEVGGSVGRTVLFELDTGYINVRTVSGDATAI